VMMTMMMMMMMIMMTEFMVNIESLMKRWKVNVNQRKTLMKTETITTSSGYIATDQVIQSA